MIQEHIPWSFPVGEYLAIQHPYSLPYRAWFNAGMDIPIEYWIDPILPDGATWIATKENQPNQLKIVVFSTRCRYMMRMAE